MEHNPNDQKVIDLLSKLKDDSTVYPSELLEWRRQKYLRQAAHLGLGMGAGAALKNALKSRGPGLPPTAGTWVEIALVLAIVAEAGTAAYLYRHKLSNLARTDLTTSTARVVTSEPVVPSPLPELSMVPAFTVTIDPTATGTPLPSFVEDYRNTGGVNSNNTAETAGANDSNYPGGGKDQTGPTPGPNDNKGNDNGNNGNHYGQTKQPPDPIKAPKETKTPKK